MANTSFAVDGTLQIPEFDWNSPIDPDLQVTLAEVGDTEMRTLLAAHPSIVHRAARELVIADVAPAVEALKSNPNVPEAWLAISVKPARKPAKSKVTARRSFSRKAAADV